MHKSEGDEGTIDAEALVASVGSGAIADDELDALYAASIEPVGQEAVTTTHREFARRVADRCAAIADEFTPPGDVENAADAIRAAFAV